MKETDTYQTIGEHSSGIYKDKGSKFIALACPVSTEEEVREELDAARKNYHDARHHCYAYVLGYQKETYRYNDDGEPAGTAGKPIYGQILSHALCNILVIVVRYFGGTKLGVRGLINAYKAASREAIQNNTILTRTIEKVYRVDFEYPHMNDVMRILKEHDLTQRKHDFDLHCSIEFSVRESMAHLVLGQFEQLSGVSLEYLFRE